jgi:uncharacterized protein (DUF58 family)
VTRPTARGVGLLAVAVGTYLAARVVGTWELYFLAFAFVAAVGVCWALVLTTARRLQVERSATPAQPVAGDPLTLRFRVKNGSVFPGLQVTLVDATGDLGGPGRFIEVESLGPRSDRVATSGPWPARRGIHRLSPQIAVAEDPLGLVRARRRLGETLNLTVSPRLTHLSTCALYAGMGLRRAGRRRRLPTVDASELRGIRPHNPGEPLNRVDWKATAKTGNLMLREMEDATDGGVAVLLNGAAASVAGELPETTFEVAVRAAGSIADFALRSGHPVTLLVPENDWRPIRLSPDAESRRRLLAILAGASPRGLAQLGPSLRTLVGGDRSRARMQSLTVVVLSLDRGLVRAAAALQEEGTPVSIVHVADDSRAPSVATAEDQSLRRALSAAGVHYIPLRRGDDLAAALSIRADVRHARAL